LNIFLFKQRSFKQLLVSIMNINQIY